MAEQFVLASTYLSGPLAGQPQYFRFWTAIGPCATPDLAEAERFTSAQEAMESPAFTHWSSFYEPKPVSALGDTPQAAKTGRDPSSPPDVHVKGPGRTTP